MSLWSLLIWNSFLLFWQGIIYDTYFWGEVGDCAAGFQDLIPQPETEPQAVAVKAQNPNHRATQGALWCWHFWSQSVQSVTQSCQTLCNPMECSTPGFLVHHQLPKLVQTHVHWVRNAIQPCDPLSSPSPPTFNLSQHQGLLMSQFFPSGGQSIGVSVSASVLPMNIQDWFPIGLTGLISFNYGKIIALIIRTFVGKVKKWSHSVVSDSLRRLFNMLSRFVIAFLPRSKHLDPVVSWNVLFSTCYSQTPASAAPAKLLDKRHCSINSKIPRTANHTIIFCTTKICRVHHEKCWTGWSTSWNQDCQEKYQ